MRWQTIRWKGTLVRYKMEPQIVRLANYGPYHLGHALFPFPHKRAIELAELLKNKYAKRYKRPLAVKTKSFATEIWGHTHLDIWYRSCLRFPLPLTVREHCRKQLVHTRIVDIGVKAVDTNRWVWDLGNRLGGWLVFR